MAKKINPVDAPIEYKLQIKLSQICATQNAQFDKRTLLNKFGYEKTLMTEYNSAAIETEKEQIQLPTQKRKTKKKRKDEQLILTHCFMRNNGNIVEPLGGTFGHVKRALRQAVTTIGIAKYKQPAVELIRFEPELVDLGKDENITLTPVLEPRSRGTTRELVYYETAKDRMVELLMKVSKTCPLTGEEIRGILTAIKDYDGFGASRRGKIESIEIVD